MNSYGSLLLCSHLHFHVYLSIDYRQYWHKFYSILKFFFFSTSFPNIVFFIFYAFVVYEPAEWNFIFLACREQKTQKTFFFNWLHLFFSWLFLYHKEVTQVFSSTLNFAWQFSYQWNRRSAILPQTQIGKFGRTKFDTHTVLSRDDILISFKNSSSSIVAFFLTQCEKSTVMFGTRPCISFAEL